MYKRTWKEIYEAKQISDRMLQESKARIDWMAYTIYFIGGLFMVDLFIHLILR